MTDGPLTHAVIATLVNAGPVSTAMFMRTAREALRGLPAEVTRYEQSVEIGAATAGFIGERLSSLGGLHGLLWQTFMSQVDWDAVGAYFLHLLDEEDEEEQAAT